MSTRTVILWGHLNDAYRELQKAKSSIVFARTLLNIVASNTKNKSIAEAVQRLGKIEKELSSTITDMICGIALAWLGENGEGEVSSISRDSGKSKRPRVSHAVQRRDGAGKKEDSNESEERSSDEHT